MTALPATRTTLTEEFNDRISTTEVGGVTQSIIYQESDDAPAFEVRHSDPVISNGGRVAIGYPPKGMRGVVVGIHAEQPAAGELRSIQLAVRWDDNSLHSVGMDDILFADGKGERDEVIRPVVIPTMVRRIVSIPPSGIPLEDIEHEALIEALKMSNWVQKDAAELLSISPRVLSYKLTQMGLIGECRDKRRMALNGLAADRTPHPGKPTTDE